MSIKNFINNLKISNKLLTIILIGVINLLIISFISNYLMLTNNIVTILAMCERRFALEVKNVQFYFEKYHNDGDENNLNKFIESIDTVNRYTDFFGRLDKLAKTESTKSLANSFYTIYDEVTSKKDAKIIADRVKLLIFIRLPLAFDLIKLPYEAFPLGEEIKKDVILYSKLDAEKKQSAYNNIQDKLDKMLVLGGEFSRMLVKLVVFVKNLSIAALFAVALLLTLLNLLLSMYISRTIKNILLKIMTGVKQISEGDFSNKIDVTRKDEFGELAENYNTMIDALNKKIEIIKKIAEGSGDFTIKIDLLSERDDFGKFLQDMLASLNVILKQVKKTAETIKTGIVHISNSAQLLSTGASEQASSIEQITSALIEINTQAEKNAENAAKANDIAKASSLDAEKGNKEMNKMVEAMKEINRYSEEIIKVVKVIDDISFQINFLSLNANVEAARAGKYGKGFAVVAEEVRSLAGRSATASTDTKKMVESSMNSVTNGNTLVDQTASQLNKIVSSFSNVASLVEEISESSKQQSSGLNQINTGLSQIDQVTQSNASNAEESASTSEILKHQVEELNKIVSQFKLQE